MSSLFMILSNSLHSDSTFISCRKRAATQNRDNLPLSSRYRVSYTKTNILLPSRDCKQSDNKSEWIRQADRPRLELQYLFVPSNEEGKIDTFLQSIPQIMDGAKELLGKPLRVFTSSTKHRLVYIAQGEVGHATADHCEVIASDKATTCHILAFRSVSINNHPLVSMAHIDTDSYQDCIKDMLSQHKLLANHSAPSVTKPQIDIYLMGGFSDRRGSSSKISNFLIKLLTQIAAQETDHLIITLRTCLVGCMNDTGYSSPIGRGLGIDIHSGEPFLCKVHDSVTGPLMELRAARVWTGFQRKKLSLVHSASSSIMTIEPFTYHPLRDTEILINLPDRLLLRYTSTSPDVEEKGFCDYVRKTLTYMSNTKYESFFGKRCRNTLSYERVENTNVWKLITSRSANRLS